MEGSSNCGCVLILPIGLIQHFSYFLSQFGSSFGYGGSIWSQQQGPRSPSGFGNMRPNPPNMWPLSSSEQQPGGFPSPQMSRAPGMKPVESWSTATDEQPSPPVSIHDDSPFPSSSPAISSESSPENGSSNDTYVCRKCDSKHTDSDSFRAHVEKCFNS